MPEHDPSLPRLAGALRRWLELNRMFGWEAPVKKRVLRPPSSASAPEAARYSPPRGRPGARPERGAPRSAPTASTPGRGARPRGGSARRGAARQLLPVVSPALALQSCAAPEEIARREKLLQPMRREVADCTDCGLCRGRIQAVFGVGHSCARLMFVGEGPGFDEDRQGEPFVGRAGRLLNDIIRAMRLRREDVYIANVIKCRPPGNRTPDLQEMASCLPYLRRQLEIIRPEVICALGAVAARGLLNTRGSLGSLRGRFHDYEDIPVRVTYHPAYLLRSPGEKRKTWEDMQEVLKLLGISLEE